MNLVKKKSVCVLVVYFGPFPASFIPWLHSAQKQSHLIDFIIVTDQILPDDLYPVQSLSISFESLREQIQGIFDFKIDIKRSYKLCDFKPAYALIFEDLLKEYSY